MKKQADTGASNSAIVKRREQLLEKARQFKGGAGEMCDVSKEIYEMGREDGIADGKAEGKAEGLIEGGFGKGQKSCPELCKNGIFGGKDCRRSRGGRGYRTAVDFRR